MNEFCTVFRLISFQTATTSISESQDVYYSMLYASMSPKEPEALSRKALNSGTSRSESKLALSKGQRCLEAG